MSLADDLAGLTPNRPGFLCKTCKLLGDLEPDDATALRAAINTPKDNPGRLSSQALADFLTGKGYDVSEQSLSKHRRGRHE